MKKLGLFLVGLLLLSGQALVSQEKKEGGEEVKGKKFGVRVSKEDVIFYTEGNFYLIQAESINAGGNILYFAAQDFSGRKELLVKKMTGAELTTDTEDRKVVKVTFALGDDKQIQPDYKLVLFTEIRKGQPYLAIYSKFMYEGSDEHTCGINWGMENAYEANKYQYYTIPKEGKEATYKLKGGMKNKIGYAKWLYAHDGKGSGAGLICPALLGKGEDFIFVNAVPQKKALKKGLSMDVFMVFMSIQKNYKVLDSIYQQISGINWKYE